MRSISRLISSYANVRGSAPTLPFPRFPCDASKADVDRCDGLLDPEQTDRDMMDRRQVLVAGGLATLPGLAACAATGDQRAHEWPAVQAFLDRCVAERRYAGVAAALSYGDSALAFPTAGTLAFDSAIPIDRNSIFRLYSITKPVTGVAAMLLVEDGSIALDQPVAEVLPELRNMRVAIDPARSLDSRPAAQAITMRQLITHTSGLSNWQPMLGDAPIPRTYRALGLTPGNFIDTPREGYGPQVRGLNALIERLPEVPLIAEPGTAWNYSMGLDVMGAVIERASGMGFDAFLRRRLFDPLDMRSTGFQVAARDAARLTTLYGRVGEETVALDRGADSLWLQPPTLLAGGGGLASTARDFARLAAMLLGEGTLDGVRVMRAETARLAMSNLLPPGVSYPPTGGGFGAGAGVVMPGAVSEIGPARAYGAIGSSSTLIAVDPARRGVSIFLAQFMPFAGPTSASFRRDFKAALETDLQTTSN
jgi:CubicO group peptidase (beta-lactamase class C family)